jgi:hypothetical protein
MLREEYSKGMQEDDSILLRSSRSDLPSRTPSPLAHKNRDSTGAKLDLPMQINTHRTGNSNGNSDEPIIYAPARSMMNRQQSDNLRASDPRLSDPMNEDYMRSSTDAFKHLYSIKPMSGAKPLHLTSSFSSTSGLGYTQQKFNQTGNVSAMLMGSKPGA